MRDVRPDPAACADLARNHDWSLTDFGPRDQWPTAVESVLSLLLESPVPMSYCHGEQLAVVYNDAMAEVLGDLHPDAWAKPAAEVTKEAWGDPRVGHVLERVLHTGKPFFEDGTVPAIEGSALTAGDSADAYMVRGLSPVRDTDGRVLGVLSVAMANTLGVVRLHTVAGLASALASAVSVDDVVKVTLRHALQTLEVGAATVCLAERRTGGWRTTRRRAADVVSSDEERLPLIWAPADPEDDADLIRVAQTGSAQGVGSGFDVVLPLHTNGSRGAVRFRAPESALTGLELPLLTTCTELVGEALARAWLYDAERGTADLLQRTMLPQVITQRPGVSVAVRYQPVTTGTAAGGDFYDVFSVGDGRLAVVIGDVVGRGVMAATVMGQVRAAVRGAALAVPEPDRVFHSLDQVVLTLDEVASMRSGAHSQRSDDALSLAVNGELFVTMLYCLLDPATGRLEMASAGHFPPVMLRDGEAVYAPLTVGPPLGLPGDRPVWHGDLAEQDALLAFTDGLLERRDRALSDGETALLAALRGSLPREPRSICQRALDRMLGEDSLEDDCALLALVRTHADHRTESVVVPPLASAVRRSRRWVQQQLETWDVGPDATWVAVTGVSELVTNVLLHAATDARITLDLSPDRLLVTVADAGIRGGPTRVATDPTSTRGRGLGLVAQIADSSGFERNVSGSTVWFEIQMP